MAERSKMRVQRESNDKLRWRYQELEQIANGATPLHRKLAYGIAVNQEAMEKHVRALQKAEKASKEFAEYEEKRIEVCQQYADRGEDGRPIMVGRNFVIVERRPEFEEAIAKLRAEPAVAKALREREEQIEQLDDLYQEEVEYPIYAVSWEYVPREFRQGSHMRALLPMLEGEPPDDEDVAEDPGTAAPPPPTPLRRSKKAAS